MTLQWKISPWIYDVYQQYFNNKHDGFVVEIGVGHVVDWNRMGAPRLLDFSQDTIIRGESTTIELLENGWTGIYIEPISEFIDNELRPMLKTLLAPSHFNQIKMITAAASNQDQIAAILADETLTVVNDTQCDSTIIPYNYRNRKVSCRKTSDILTDNDCPYDIDIMSIDVEGHEANTLRGIDFTKHRPKLLLIEVNHTAISTIENILPQGYQLIKRDDINAIFVDQ